MNKTMMGMAFLISQALNAQDSSTTENSAKPLTFSGYVEGYYSYDFNKPPNNMRPAFMYNHNRHNEFNVNLAFIRSMYAKGKVRANLAIAVGTYVNANYAAEPGTLQNVYEASAGYKLSTRKNLWLDIGILPSHIGFESAVGKDNWTLTRSILAENSPYFESGVKLGYTSDNGKLQMVALALNGWQRISRTEGNSLLSFGTQVFFKPSDKLTLNYSTFIGTDEPDSNRLWRYFHNIYGIFQFTDKFGLIAGFDVGTQQKTVDGKKLNTWYSPIAILRFTPTDKWSIALRSEYYSDKNGVIIATGTQNGFRTSGFSVNVDYIPQTAVMLRVEGRTFISKDDIFEKENYLSNTNTAITFSTTIVF